MANLPFLRSALVAALLAGREPDPMDVLTDLIEGLFAVKEGKRANGVFRPPPELPPVFPMPQVPPGLLNPEIIRGAII